MYRAARRSSASAFVTCERLTPLAAYVRVRVARDRPATARGGRPAKSPLDGGPAAFLPSPRVREAMVPPVRRRDRPPGEAVRESPARILAGRALVGGRLQPLEIAIAEDGRILSMGRIRS